MRVINPLQLFERVECNIFPDEYKEHILEVTDGDFKKCWNCGREQTGDVYFVGALNPKNEEYALLLCPKCYDCLKKVLRITHQEIIDKSIFVDKK